MREKILTIMEKNSRIDLAEGPLPMIISKA